MAFNDDDMAFPFAKVAKQLDNGPVDGIASFFRAVPIIFEDLSLARPATPKKPWWKVW